MDNKKMTISVTCETDEIAKKYEVLARKMANDEEFNNSLKNCKSEREVYNLYVQHGYTDLSFEEFSAQLGDTLSQINQTIGNKTTELSSEELESVVGGYNFFRVFTSILSAVPIAGPILSGVAKAIKAGVDGKGAEGVILNIGVGIAGSLFDTAIAIATGGAGEVAKAAFKVGAAGFKASVNESTFDL